GLRVRAGRDAAGGGCVSRADYPHSEAVDGRELRQGRVDRPIAHRPRDDRPVAAKRTRRCGARDVEDRDRDAGKVVWEGRDISGRASGDGGSAGRVMEDAEKRRVARIRKWAAKLGLSIKSLRTRPGVLLGFYLCDEQ